MNSERILIITHPHDAHAHAVAEAIKRKGGGATIWNTSSFPRAMTESVRISKSGQEIKVRGPEFDLLNPSFDVIWNRRLTFNIDDEILHTADVGYARLTCRTFRISLLNLMSPGSMWVNPPGSEGRCNKITQLAVALDIGLSFPETLFSNDPDDIREFIRSHGGAVAYKSISPMLQWRDNGKGKAWELHTSIVSEEDLVSDDILRMTPSIYQALIPKSYELRVTMIGEHEFTAKILSQETVTGKLDWRKAYHELEMEPYTLPAHVSNLCRKLMRRLDIVFGAFDFVVTPDGEYVFLEVNQMGQFLFVERFTGQPLMDAFSEMLLQGNSDFDYPTNRDKLKYEDIAEIIPGKIDAACKVHIPPPEDFWNEREPNMG